MSARQEQILIAYLHGDLDYARAAEALSETGMDDDEIVCELGRDPGANHEERAPA